MSEAEIWVQFMCASIPFNPDTAAAKADRALVEFKTRFVQRAIIEDWVRRSPAVGTPGTNA